jgi:lysophospholipase L1-like esterase
VEIPICSPWDFSGSSEVSARFALKFRFWARKGPAVVIAIAAGALLSGCGNSGDFSIPPPFATPRSPPTTSPDPTQGTTPTSTVLGETLTFRGTETRQPYFPCHEIFKVYSYGSGGSTVAYEQGKDYTITSSCGIARTEQSRIPDVLSYSYVDTNSRSATVADDAPYNFVDQPRNPPPTIAYEVLLDYASEPMVYVAPKAHRDHNNVFIFGDSIAGGAALASFSDSFAAKLSEQYPRAAFTNVFESGGSIDRLYDHIDEVMGHSPDLVIIEFGMNDHVFGANSLPLFTTRLDTIVAKFVASGIDVVAVGFFQENTRFTMENPVDTQAYNQAIHDVAARYHVPFVDIQTAFAKLAASGKRIEDMTADFIHHPTSFGQSVYFSLIAPYVGPGDAFNGNSHFVTVE